ncbi:carbohydrate ABC transporter substrate-binding protein, CUT1 family [Streptomyces melanosporofaciens]|uniref:Carbohydrate ABC transporter substrate-binding protein, CUT1 family n=1 Tax=Streptomyces melanosporofaciens TaxID=67327 RepID=A0A1H4IAP4_STRMJ|nr:carbohydrate ABC transporter substrate-binding protein, CUT1 family [Streptomyces melanosporofaciens]
MRRPAGGAKEVSFLVFETPNLTPEYWDKAIKRVTDRHPDIHVKKIVAPSAGERNAYAKQLLASGQLPDVMQAVAPSGFAESGRLYAWREKELAAYQYPHSNPLGGKIYQLPYNTQPTPLVYYNKKLFARAGITAPPKTYAELLADGAALKAKGINPFVVGGGGKDAFAAAYLWIALVGADVYREQPDFLAQRRADKVTFSDPVFVKATQKFADLVEKGYIDKAGLSRDYPSTEKAFLDGKGAMYPMGSWFAASADAKTLPFDIGVFAWPTDDGTTVVPAYTGGGPIVNAHAKNLEAAKTFALEFNQNAANNDVLVKSDAAIIAIKGYKPPAMGPVYQDTLKVLRSGKVANAFTVETGDDALLPGVSDKVFAIAQQIVAGKTDGAQAGRLLDQEWAKADGR